MMDLSLHAVYNAYLKGSQKPIQKNPPDEFGRLVNMKMEKRLPLNVSAVTHLCFGLAENGLAAVRKGDISTAERIFQAANLLLQSEAMTQESYLLGKSFCEAAMAYLDYRHGNFEKAQIRVQEALSCDLILEKEYDYDILHIHRIQLAHNLMRIMIRQECFQEGLALGCQLLNYMENKVKVLPIPVEWNSSMLRGLSPQLLDRMFALITVEIALALAKSKSLSVTVMSTGMHWHTAATCYLCPPAHRWLKAKDALINHDERNFLREATQFLVNGPGEYPRLWYAFLADVVTFCDQIDLIKAKHLKDAIIKDITSIKDIPIEFRQIIIYS